MGTVGLIVPTLNAGVLWPQWIEALQQQTLQPDRVLVVDSSSEDDTADLARRAGLEVKVIARSEFDHGGTRQSAAEQLADVDILIYLTQDAVLAGPGALAELVRAFDDPKITSAYGRQLAAAGATPIAAHHRAYNYPPDSRTYSQQDFAEAGLQAVFCSNSFAAYRRQALMAVGGFESQLIFGEDMLAAARLQLAGGQHRYVAEAAVYHSHNYTPLEDFRRYFDMGVMHRDAQWLMQQLQSAEGKGVGFVVSELRNVGKGRVTVLFSLLVRNGMRWTGYKFGKLYRYLPPVLRKSLGMNRKYWSAQESSPPQSA